MPPELPPRLAGVLELNAKPQCHPGQRVADGRIMFGGQAVKGAPTHPLQLPAFETLVAHCLKREHPQGEPGAVGRNLRFVICMKCRPS
jgi:hypothetical protein